jgi:threonine dehydratase
MSKKVRNSAPEFAAILAARERIRGHVIETPTRESLTLGEIAGCRIFLKFENRQFTASFKERGAANRLAQLSAAKRRAGVIAVSAGNHAQGLAYHASRLGIPAVIVMPRFTPFVKIENTQRLGAEVVLSGETFAAAREEMARIAAERALTIVHPYDDRDIIAGQGTIGIEMLEAVPDLDTLVVSIGGGGLIAGIATAARHLKPGIEIIGVQAELFRGAYELWQAHHGHDEEARAASLSSAPAAAKSRASGGPTIAEGIAVEHPGALTMPVIDELVDDILLVSEADIERAIVLVLEIEKTLVEGAGAAGLAAVLAYPERFAGKRVGLVLCGGNIDSLTLADIIERNLVRNRRLARLSISAPDKPGSLARIAAIIAEQGANVEEVTHQRAFADLPVRYVRIDMVVSTRGKDHLEATMAALAAAGYEAQLRLAG